MEMLKGVVRNNRWWWLLLLRDKMGFVIGRGRGCFGGVSS